MDQLGEGFTSSTAFIPFLTQISFLSLYLHQQVMNFTQFDLHTGGLEITMDSFSFHHDVAVFYLGSTEAWLS